MDRRSLLRGTAATAAGAAVLPALPANAAEQGPWGHPSVVHPGIQVLADDNYRLLRGQRVGLISNPTGILPDLRHEIDVMHASDQFELVAAFGPEHGFRGTKPPGGHDDYFVDPRTGIPIYGSYSPGAYAEVFTEQRIDTVVFDIQDIGARFYTYIWTMYRAMRGAVRAGCRFAVLDRPNPISGVEAYGPMLYPEYSTAVGLKPICQQHGMTVGELAHLFNAEFLPADEGSGVQLEVVRMRRWTRDMYFGHTSLPWVLPSPNMPTVDTATVYPGTCLFEGTNVSEGRGTTRPFELIGAPYMDYRWARELAAQELPGAGFREAYYAPTFSKYEGDTCGGAQLYVTDHRAFRPIRTTIAMLIAAKQLYPDQFAWRYDSWDEEHPYWIDKLTGSAWVRTAIDSGKGVDEVVDGWQRELGQFRQLREKHLLYHRIRGRGLLKTAKG